MMSTPGIIIIGVCIALSMFIGFAIATTPSSSLQSDQLENLLCDELSEFQYKCDRPVIDPETEQPVTCQPDNSVILNCMVADGVLCEGLMNSSRIFEKSVDNACDYDAHLDYSTALLLSIFLGLFGVDRIYLGYYATGLFKMFSMGGLCIFWLVDIVLIALQVLLPSDVTIAKMATAQQMEVVAELEVEMMSDMYRKMTTACQEKCIAKTFKEGELTKGEAVCLDRCVAKYLDVHEKLGKRLTNMSQTDDAALQKISAETQ